MLNISFSPNGYHMASLDSNMTVSIWDLRKTDKLVNQIAGQGTLLSLEFSPCGKALLLAGDRLQVLETKNWQPVSSISGCAASVTCVSSLGECLVTGGMDRQLSIYR